MGVRVKICGITTPHAAAAAVEAGADAVGFVFADSPRRVTPEQAAAIVRTLPASVVVVAVFRHPRPEDVRRVLEVVGPDRIQTDAEDLPLAGLPEGLELPVFRDSPGVVERFESGSSRRGGRAFLFEAATSGSGTTVRAAVARRLARRGRLVLAGGLTALNVADSIRRIGPGAVDVSSGVESAPGVKDPSKIAAFVRAVRGTCVPVPGGSRPEESIP